MNHAPRSRPLPGSAPRRSHGFTLVELMVTIGVAAILLAAAIPAFRTMMQNSRISGQASTLIYSLNLARSEAIKRDQPQGVQVCSSSNGTSCNGAAWNQGWIVMDVSSGTVLQAVSALAYNATLTNGPALVVTFLPDGSVTTPASFKLCDSRGAAYARNVVVNTIGRIEASATPGMSLGPPSVALTCP